MNNSLRVTTETKTYWNLHKKNFEVTSDSKENWKLAFDIRMIVLFLLNHWA